MSMATDDFRLINGCIRRRLACTAAGCTGEIWVADVRFTLAQSDSTSITRNI
jgi:hypothetical protein